MREHQRQGTAQEPQAEHDPRKTIQPAGGKSDAGEHAERHEPACENGEGLAMARDTVPTAIHAAELGDQVMDDDGGGAGEQIVGRRIPDDPQAQAQAGGDAEAASARR